MSIFTPTWELERLSKPPPSPFINSPSIFQENIFAEIKSGESSLLIEAVAGSGKTSTIVHSTSLIPPHILTVFLAFNKNIATELESRVPRHIQVGTFHSRCLKALARNLPKYPKVEKDKVRNILSLAQKEKAITWNEFEIYAQFVCKLVSLAKGAGIVPAPDQASVWSDLIGKFGLVSTGPDFDESRAITLANRCLEESNADTKVIDYDDMLYLAYIRNITFDKASRIFIDEAQDTNFIQRELTKRMGDFGPNRMSRLIAVGDPSQAIYGFRGADADSMTAIAKDFNCKRLPLSISYRCSKAVVREAQKYTSGILPSDSALEGEVKHLDKFTSTDFLPSSAILCRNTAPLVSFAFSLIRRHIGCRVLGREIGQGLVTLIKKLDVNGTIEMLTTKLELYESKEVEKFERKGELQSADAIRDKCQCISIFLSHCSDVSELCSRIGKLFDDTSSGLLTLSTVHKAKGLEWPKVFILDKAKLMPSPFARLDWQKQQEINLIYVAVTRAKLDLVYIESNKWKEEKVEEKEDKKMIDYLTKLEDYDND